MDIISKRPLLFGKLRPWARENLSIESVYVQLVGSLFSAYCQPWAELCHFSRLDPIKSNTLVVLSHFTKFLVAPQLWRWSTRLTGAAPRRRKSRHQACASTSCCRSRSRWRLEPGQRRPRRRMRGTDDGHHLQVNNIEYCFLGCQPRSFEQFTSLYSQAL